MKILFLGGDRRQLEIINSLYQKGNDIHLVGYDNRNFDINVMKKNVNELKMEEYNAVIFPVSGVENDLSITTEFNSSKVTLPSDILVNTRYDAIIFTGIMTDELNQMLKMAQHKAVVLMDDNEIKKENSVPTVEGIIGDLIYNTDYTISGSNILILGYGNVGKLLATKLRCLGANVTVGVITKEDFNSLQENQINGFYTNYPEIMKSVIKSNDIIINTVPNILLSKEYLESVSRGAYILDIASHPHGTDFATANEMQIKNKLLLGIPSLTAPKTAGLILTKKIDSILGGDKK